MLDQNPYDRLTVEEVLGMYFMLIILYIQLRKLVIRPCYVIIENKWIQNAHKVPNIPLGEHVRARIQQFSLMNKFKRKVIRVSSFTYFSMENFQKIAT